MTQMIRKQVYIEPRQQAILKRLARMLGVTEAQVIRGAIDRQTTLLRPGARDLRAWEKEKAFIQGRMAAGPVSVSRQWHREDAYKERLTRYGR